MPTRSFIPDGLPPRWPSDTSPQMRSTPGGRRSCSIKSKPSRRRRSSPRSARRLRRGSNSNLVLLSAELAFHRRLSLSKDALVDAIESGGRATAPIEEAIRVYHWLAWRATPFEKGTILAMRIARAERFLDANWAAIMALAATAADAKPEENGWATTPATSIERILARRPVKLSDTQRKDRDNRRTRSAYDAGQRIVALMGIGDVD